MGYFDNANRDLLARADLIARTVLELGCGTGARGAALTAPDAPARLTAIHAAALAERMAPAVRPLPFLDYPDDRREMLAADVGICPLTASEFNACKSDLKIMECLAHGTVPLVSAEAAAQTEVATP